jgi:hypothetical protein
MLAACASYVVPATDGAVPRDAAGGCMLPNGGTCARGTSCPAGDGCNTCACSTSGALACTERACQRVCTTSADCPPGQQCAGSQGCDVQWTCQHTLCSNPPMTWCGCDGQTYTTTNGCATRPFVHEGPCETPMADAGPSCLERGAMCNTSNECCTGYCMAHGAPFNTCETPPTGLFGCGTTLCNLDNEYCELTFSDVPTPDSALCRPRNMCTGVPVNCMCVAQHTCGGCNVIDANTVAFHCPGG